MPNPAQIQQFERAARLHQSGNHDAAWDLLQPILSDFSGDVQAQMTIGMVARAKGDPALAQDHFGIAHQLSPENPQIANIYANSLSAVGEIDAATTLFEQIIKAHPQFLDAHINYALTLDEHGRHDQATDAADAGLKLFNNHPRLIAIKAMAQKNAGDIAAALSGFSTAIKLDPDRALTHHNYGVALVAAGEFESAMACFAKAAQLGKNDLSNHLSWAAAALETGQIDQAREMYRQILSAIPDHDEASRARTRIIIEYDKGEDPFAHYAALAHAQPTKLSHWHGWIQILLGHAAYDLLLKATDEASRYHSGDLHIQAVHHFARGMMEDAQAPMLALRQLVQHGPVDPAIKIMLVQLALKAHDPKCAALHAEQVIQAAPYDQAGWAYLATAWRMLDDPREHWLCGYDHYIMETEIPSAELGLNASQYAAIVARCLNNLHQTISAPGDQSLRHGTQTSGALFDRQNPEIVRFRAAIESAVHRAINALPYDPSHPFLGRKSETFHFSGSWSVRLQNAGHHVPHFHAMGWISSAYYAALPDVIHTDDTGHQGHIAFGAPPDSFGLNLSPRRIIAPEPGKLVLFPSYVWHGTIPFASKQPRLTAAFDVLPD